ncbi:MAG: hypothetical protein FWF79_09565 [Defluviitaleaceae bacterium]|nr:hypothetical protein [Defluviitaleaceae bacterium]
MDAKPAHSFEIAGAKGGLMSMFSGKPMLELHNGGISWMEGKSKVFVEYSKIEKLQLNKYYSTLTIVHTGKGASETKKVSLINAPIFETVWMDFSGRQNIGVKLALG